MSSTTEPTREWKCPRCTQRNAPAGETCLHCGFSLAEMDDVFGTEAVLMDRVTDAAGILSRTELEGVEQALLKFERRFPQLFAAVYCGALPEQTSLRQFGFWLLNRAAVRGLDAMRPNENGLLLVLDVHGRSAALVPGYFPECYLNEFDLQQILEAAGSEFRRNAWKAGMLAALDGLSRRLRRRAAEAAKAPERFTPARPQSPPAAPQFVRIREGHSHEPAVSATKPRQ